MSSLMRVLSFSELKPSFQPMCRLHCTTASRSFVFCPNYPGAWRESHIDDWMRARRAKGDLSWMFAKEARRIAVNIAKLPGLLRKR
jgi:hypothetical protein